MNKVCISIRIDNQNGIVAIVLYLLLLEVVVIFLLIYIFKVQARFSWHTYKHAVLGTPQLSGLSDLVSCCLLVRENTLPDRGTDEGRYLCP